MKITFKLHANLTDYLPRDQNGSRSHRMQLQIEVPDGSDVQSVIDRFHLPASLVHLVLVNGVYVAPSQRSRRVLSDGDSLALWPPIAGG